jgi:hypothetical protein
MILGLLRLSLFLFVVQTILYVLISIYSRSVRREKLEKEFDAGGIEGHRDAFIEAGMQAYQHGLRRRLIWLVYIIPAVVIPALVYFVNFRYN